MPPVQHRVRATLFGSEQTFSLGEAALRIDGAQGASEIPFRDIDRIGLIAYAGAGGTQGQATLRTKTGQTVKIRSHHYKTLANFENRSESYRDLVSGLMHRVAAANPDARFVSGSTVMSVVWWVVLAIIVCVLVLLGLAMASGEELKGNVLGGFMMMLVALPFAWRSARQNREKPIDPSSPPHDVLEFA